MRKLLPIVFVVVMCPACESGKRGVFDSAEDVKVKQFKEKVRAYLEESRAFAKSLAETDSITEAESRKGAERVRELYTHLPDVPPSIDKSDSLAIIIKRIHRDCNAGDDLMIRAFKSLRSGNLADAKKVRDDLLPHTVKSIRSYCDEAEAKIAEG